jgi:phosphatidylglycerophosphate synthase
MSNHSQTEHPSARFSHAVRLASNPMASLERRCLVWLAARLPRRVNSDHLTLLALAAMAFTGLSYAAARFTRVGLFLAVAGLVLNWFGDSLDGTLARVRRQERPRYGFYVDHIVDCVGVGFLVAGLASSGYMSPIIAASFLVAYFMLSIEIYLATYCLAVFRLSFWGVGPTELRILLAVGTVALVSDPKVHVFGGHYRLFDVGGLVAVASIALMLVTTISRNVQLLYRAEPLRETDSPDA